MNTHIFQLSWQEFVTAFGMGLGLGVVCMYLLWKTVKTLPQVKHKGIFLFVSVVLRIFLLMYVAVALSQDHAGRFILIICGVVVMRLFILRFTKMGAYYQTEQKEMTKAVQYRSQHRKGRRKK